MEINFQNFKEWLLDNENYTTEDMELIIDAIFKFNNQFIEEIDYETLPN